MLAAALSHHNMRTLTKITTIGATALMMAITVSMYATAHAAFGEQLIVLDSEETLTAIDEDDGNHDIDTQVSSLRVTQSTEDGLEVECEGNLKCEIIGDDTVVATSEDNNSTTTVTTTASTTRLNQSNIIQFGDDFDVIDEQDLGTMIEGMVDRLLDEISRKLVNLDISI
jgi:hypothetical protein